MQEHAAGGEAFKETEKRFLLSAGRLRAALQPLLVSQGKQNDDAYDDRSE
jgi:hypothetical protein